MTQPSLLFDHHSFRPTFCLALLSLPVEQPTCVSNEGPLSDLTDHDGQTGSHHDESERQRPEGVYLGFEITRIAAANIRRLGIPCSLRPTTNATTPSSSSRGDDITNRIDPPGSAGAGNRKL
jgi:hypothetical protein